MKTIGETFPAELFSAGCNNGVSYTIGGTEEDIHYGPNADQAAVALVIAAHDPAPKLKDIKAAKLDEINNVCQTIADQLTVGYPEFEKQTWPDQQREALAWSADNNVSTPRIDALAGYRGIERTVYLQKTVVKVNALIQASNYLVGTRQKYADQVSSATSVAQVAAIDPVFTLG